MQAVSDGANFGIPGKRHARDPSWEVMIVLSWYKGRYDKIFSDCQQVDSILIEASMPGINFMPVYVCRKPKMPVKDIWTYLKYY